MVKPALFVGSSSEGLDFARAVRTLLASDAEVTLWNEGFFLVGNTFIESLVPAISPASGRPRYDWPRDDGNPRVCGDGMTAKVLWRESKHLVKGPAFLMR